MFGKRIKIFKLLGFEVRVDLSWIIIAVLVTWSLAAGLFPQYYEGLSKSTYWWMGVIGALGLFAGIIVHEFSHSVVARRFGLPMRGITLFIFGGVAEMEEEPANPKVEFYMAIAGPLASILIGLMFHLVYAQGSGAGWSVPVIGVLSYLRWINFVLAGFNLLPAFPLDGGRILRSILWRWKGNLSWATRIATEIGSGFGLAMIFLGILVGFTVSFISGMWWFLIGLFLRNASLMSYQRVLVRRALEGEPVSRFMKPQPLAAPATIPVSELVDEYIYKHHFKMFPVVENDRLVGCITTREIKEVPREEWDRRTVREVAKSCSAENTVKPDTDAMKALQLMHRTGNSRLMVVKDEALVGILSLKDLLGFLHLKIDLEGEEARAGRFLGGKGTSFPE